MTSTQIITVIIANIILLPMLYVQAKEADTLLKTNRKNDRHRNKTEWTLLALISSYTVDFIFKIATKENESTLISVTTTMFDILTITLWLILSLFIVNLAKLKKLDGLRLLLTTVTLTLVVIAVVI